MIEMDIFTWGGTKYLTIIDGFSKVAVAKLLARKLAAKVHEAVLEVIGSYGCPEKAVADQGREFNNRKLRDLLSELGIDIHYTTTGHSR